MSRWIDQAHALVAQVALEIPDGATLRERRKALRKAGPPFHRNTYWGRKQWGRACREYLAKHGGPAMPPRGTTPDVLRLQELEDRGDITFPFREGGRS